MTKVLIPSENESNRTNNTNTPPQTSITKRLWTDLGRSVEMASNWYCKTGLRDPNLPTNDKRYVIKRTHI